MAKQPKPQLRKATHKKALIEALEKSLGVVTTACKTVGIERTTYYRYLNDDPAFREAVDELDNVALDFAESQLHKQIQKGVPSSTIFYLKTKGKKRGYIETNHTEHTGKDGSPIETTSTIVIQGVGGNKPPDDAV